MATTKPSILLVDDIEDQLETFRVELSKLVPESEADIRTWLPNEAGQNPSDTFNSKVDDGTVLVITDYDLTSRGVTGLFGFSIVGWCQARALPAGDFSRASPAALPKEPNLFELRVPTTQGEAARFTASTFRGFKRIREALVVDEAFMSNQTSLATVLTTLLGRPHLESQFAQYMSRLGSANSSLIERLRSHAVPKSIPDGEKAQLLTYILGHVLLNAILKYPGPILSEKALCAYVTTTIDEIEAIVPLFAGAAYDGPFSDSARFFWREDVDDILDRMGGPIAAEQFASFGDFNRRAVETALARELATHTCVRCDGRKGGFLCPFTQRPVCERSDCSVSASSWIPQGAQLSRVERTFYDEWAPLLGL